MWHPLTMLLLRALCGMENSWSCRRFTHFLSLSAPVWSEWGLAQSFVRSPPPPTTTTPHLLLLPVFLVRSVSHGSVVIPALWVSDLQRGCSSPLYGPRSAWPLPLDVYGSICRQKIALSLPWKVWSGISLKVHAATDEPCNTLFNHWNDSYVSYSVI